MLIKISTEQILMLQLIRVLMNQYQLEEISQPEMFFYLFMVVVFLPLLINILFLLRSEEMVLLDFTMAREITFGEISQEFLWVGSLMKRVS